jgi:hypothetical protein
MVQGMCRRSIEQPRECPFNCPPPGNHLESLIFLVGRRFQVDFVRLLQTTYLLFKPLSRISTVDPYLVWRLDTIGKTAVLIAVQVATH